MIPTVNIEHGTNGLTASVSGDCKAPLFLIISQSFTCWTFEVKHLHSETAVLHQLLRFSDKSPLDWILSLDSFSLPLLLIKHCPPLAALARVPSAQLSYSRSPMTETQRHWEKKKTDKKKKEDWTKQWNMQSAACSWRGSTPGPIRQLLISTLTVENYFGIWLPAWVQVIQFMKIVKRGDGWTELTIKCLIITVPHFPMFFFLRCRTASASQLVTILGLT